MRGTPNLKNLQSLHFIILTLLIELFVLSSPLTGQASEIPVSSVSYTPSHCPKPEIPNKPLTQTLLELSTTKQISSTEPRCS